MENKYPECEKLHAVHEESQKLGYFLEWLTGEYGVTLCKWHDSEYSPEFDEDFPEGFYPTYDRIQEILAKYFDIDMNKVDEERAQILEELRSKHND